MERPAPTPPDCPGPGNQVAGDMVPSMSMPSLTLVRDDIAQADADVVAVPMRAGSESAVLDGAAERLGAAYDLELPT
jgi:hypothetical protein